VHPDARKSWTEKLLCLSVIPGWEGSVDKLGPTSLVIRDYNGACASHVGRHDTWSSDWTIRQEITGSVRVHGVTLAVIRNGCWHPLRKWANMAALCCCNTFVIYSKQPPSTVARCSCSRNIKCRNSLCQSRLIWRLFSNRLRKMSKSLRVYGNMYWGAEHH
jgi:hypothetical protein